MNCNNCKSSLDGGDILEVLLNTGKYETLEQAEAAAALYGWTRVNKKRFSRAIIYQYDDKEQEIKCPDCKMNEPCNNKS